MESPGLAIAAAAAPSGVPGQPATSTAIRAGEYVASWITLSVRSNPQDAQIDAPATPLKQSQKNK
jgi:hypothetical protein